MQGIVDQPFKTLQFGYAYEAKASAGIAATATVPGSIRAAAESRPPAGRPDVGRLVADADHTNAEFAVLAADDHHGLGLGSLLTDYCLDICKSWDIGTVVAETAPNNFRMLAIFEHRGFKQDRSVASDVVLVTKKR